MVRIPHSIVDQIIHTCISNKLRDVLRGRLQSSVVCDVCLQDCDICYAVFGETFVSACLVSNKADDDV
jgi:hypothetical protein